MDWKIFWSALVVGVALVVLQGILSWFDGYLTQAQMRSHGVFNGWSLMEHGGMWADVFIISPLVAYAASKYTFEYISWRSTITLTASVFVVLMAMQMYQRGGITTPEAHTHSGVTPLQGWVHGMFAVAVIWVGVQVYLGWTTPVVSKGDLIIFAVLLTPFFYLGVAKFSERWLFDTGARWQVAVGTIGIWVVTLVRLKFA